MLGIIRDMPRVGVLFLLAALAAAAPAAAAAMPIPQGPGSGALPAFTGAPATPAPVTAPDPPRHPYMAPNARSNIHNDAYQTDTYQGYGPLGRGGITTRSAFVNGESASITFDARGRLVTVCVG